ncbi:HNH endonuclease signature motif containing protein [Demequina iriomotensis]|uniref:HNH endonuclease signature motif containing protein n=1 Tax=Demequina iriomotensis TaxID=1536641 RepID=UPI0007842B7E|nr:HNH endonuclease signature motif containing protein [Demequina iriomotensis]
MAPELVLDPVDALRVRVEAADGLADWDAVALMREAVARRRSTDLVVARMAAQLAARCGPGRAGLASRHGFAGIDQLIAAETGGTVAEAERLRIMGTALYGGPDDAPGGATVLPHLACEAREGRLSVDKFVLLREVLMRHPDAREMDGLVVDDAVRATALGRLPLARVETMAVDKAVISPLRTVRSLVAQLHAGLTPPSTGEEEYEELYLARQATVREEANGMVRLVAILDPLTAAPLMAALDGYLKKQFRAYRDGDGGAVAPTPGQMRADGLGWLGRHATGCREPHDAVKTTVTIRICLDDLKTGHGYGEIDGIRRPLPGRLLGWYAADAEVIPTVLGTRGEVLDHGHAERLYTPAQRRAIAQRDRGCAWCGAPPSHCDVHHIRHWVHGGPTDLDNGIMLCVACHHWIHRDQWAIRLRHGSPEFIPPAAIDPHQQPRPGYQARIRPTHAELTAASRAGPP